MIRILVGVLLGAGLGAGVGYLGRCSGGMCPMTCNPIGGMIVGAIIGGILLTTTGCSGQKPTAEISINVVEIQNSEQFDKTITSGVVLVDFNADWCGPCRTLKPIIGSLADKFAGKAVVVSVNVDRQGDLARKYGISSIPDVRLFSGGKEVERWIGVRSKETYESTVEKVMGGSQ